jgi:MinD-like ATPase involved in chromosome partitioning or flagellar assembly
MPNNTVVVTLECPLLGEDMDLKLPGDVETGRLLPRLVEALGLLPGPYHLSFHERPLAEDETLFAAGVFTGTVLHLHPGPASTRKAQVRPERATLVEHAPAPPPTAGVGLADLLPSQATPTRSSEGKAIGLWSGPAGGTGRTTLALGLSTWAVERGGDVLLAALSEPAISAYLRLGRVPNLTTYYECEELQTALQNVGWDGPDGPCRLPVLLGPARPGEPALQETRAAAVLAAARALHALVLLDLPALVAGGSPWALQILPLLDHLVLVAAPTTAGVAAVVEALATLRDVGGAGHVRAHLVIVRRAPGGLSAHDVTAGVAGMWGSCPPLAAEIPFMPQLVDLLNRGELPTAALRGREDGTRPRKDLLPNLSREEERLERALESLARAVGLSL